jgi:hypothetical protein
MPLSVPAQMAETAVRCRHCGLSCEAGAVSSPQGTFCCQGCEAVFGFSAILMPISSLTIVALSAGGMRWSARRMLPA